MLNDGVYGNSIFPPLLCKKVVIRTVDVLQLFTIPYTLITNQPEKVILPDKCFVTKQTGTAYAINGATLNFSWAGTTVWASWSAARLIGFIDSVALTSVLVPRPSLSGINSTVVPFPTIIGQNLTVHNSVANFTVGTGDLVFWLTFRVFNAQDLGWF